MTSPSRTPRPRAVGVERPAPTVQRTPVDGPEGAESPLANEALVRELSTLRRALEDQAVVVRELLQYSAPSDTESLFALRERKPQIDWPSIDALEQAWRADPEAASNSQLFRTPRQLLEKYGPPSAIYRPSKGGLLFHYRRGAEDAPGPSSYFRVQDGYVVEYFVENP